MKMSEAIGKEVFYMRRDNISIIKEVRKVRTTDNNRDVFLCYLENGSILNSVVLHLLEDNSELVIES